MPEFDGKNVSSVMGFESNQLPANAPIEDRRSAATCLQTRGMLLGVFDGHAGCACAQVKFDLKFFQLEALQMQMQCNECKTESKDVFFFFQNTSGRISSVQNIKFCLNF